MDDQIQATLRSVGSDNKVSPRADQKDSPAFMSALARLLTLSQSKASGPKMVNNLHIALGQLVQITAAGNAAILITDDSSQDLNFALIHKDSAASPLAWRRVPVGHGVSHWVRETGRMAVINSSQNDERFLAAADGQLDDDTQSLMVAPLLAGRRSLGVVQVVNKRSGALFTSADQDCLSVFCHFAARLLRILAYRGGG